MMSLVIIVGSTVIGIIEGSGAEAAIAALAGFAWVGWIAVLAGLPLWLVFLGLLPMVAARLSAPVPIVAAVVSSTVWVVAAVCLGGLAAVSNNVSLDPPVTLDRLLIILLAVGVLGASFGLVEGTAGSRSAT
jgi:hypothetical protein